MFEIYQIFKSLTRVKLLKSRRLTLLNIIVVWFRLVLNSKYKNTITFFFSNEKQRSSPTVK